MPLQTVESTRLYRQIAEQISTLIDRREFPAGSRLPAERELAVLLGVSRTSVREAIIALELAGRVEVRVGTGIFVLGSPADVKHDPGAEVAADDAPGPFDVLAARALVEGEIAALAARNARKADIVALREKIAQMRERENDAEERDAADRTFHIQIAEMTGNSALPLAVANLWKLRAGAIWTRIEAYFHTPALRAKTLTDHEAIVAALEAHDADRARDAMHRHLRRVAREFQRRWDEAARSAEWGESGAKSGRESRAKLTGNDAGGRVAAVRPARNSPSGAGKSSSRARTPPQDIDRPASESGSNTAEQRASARTLHKPGGDS